MAENLNPPPQLPPPADTLEEFRVLIWRQTQEIIRLTNERNAADDACLRIANEAADASRVRADTLQRIIAEVEECKRLTIVTAHQRDCCERALRNLVELLVSVGYDTNYEDFRMRFERAQREAVELIDLIDAAKKK